MKSKFILTLLSIFISGCSNPDIPIDIKDFINHINFKTTFEKIRQGTFSQTYLEIINGQTSGTNSINFSFSKDEENINFNATYTFSGTQIKDNIISKNISLRYIDFDEYSFIVSSNLGDNSKIINYEQAYEMYYKIFDTNIQPYVFGGLYFGDYFAINLNKFYKLYSLNEENSLLTIKEENARYYDNIALDQIITIDSYGMLIYKQEKARALDSGNNAVLEQNANYIYI